LKQNGCTGTLLDHSEHPAKGQQLIDTIGMCRKEHLMVVLCADDTTQMQTYSQLKPDILVYEPPELIATGNSVSQSKPDVLTESVWIGKKAGVPVWCGAGVSNGEDVLKAIELGAVGVLIASWIAASKSQEKAVKELADALKRI
jgi:triosephosphate isomerase